MASHVLCDCETLATFRFRHLNQHFMKPGNLEEILSAGYCTCSKSVAAKCMNIRAALKIKCGQSSWVTVVPALPVLYSVLFYSH